MFRTTPFAAAALSATLLLSPSVSAAADSYTFANLHEVRVSHLYFRSQCRF
ncbi:cold-active zinc metallopeptidase M1 family protein [Alishewanella longhuensis]